MVENQFGHHLNPDDFFRGMANEHPIAQGDTILRGNYFEGDINQEELEELIGLSKSISEKGEMVRNPLLLWPNGEVPYVISSSINSQERGIIASAMAEFHEKTCIKFVPRVNQNDYIHIVKKDGCWAVIGRSGNVQEVSLGGGCVHKGIVQHEFMHVIGMSSFKKIYPFFSIITQPFLEQLLLLFSRILA